MKAEKMTLYYHILIFLLLATGIVIIMSLYYQSYEREFKKEVEQQLTSVGDLKVNGLVTWRDERLGDANLLYKNPAFSSLVNEFEMNPAGSKAGPKLNSWLSNLQSYFSYNRVYLLSPDGDLLFIVPNTTKEISSVVLGNITPTLESGEIKFLDFYMDENDQQIYLTLLVPVFGGETSVKPLGVVGLQVNPGDYLYPYIKEWPTSSSTAETLLVRKEEDNVLYLNELRFRPGIPLSLRLPLNMTDRPAVKAVLGQEGIVEGLDYQGSPVLADIRKIPDSPWFMVARINTSEVYRPLYLEIITLTIIVLLLVIGTGGVILLFRQRESKRFYRSQLELKAFLYESEERLRLSLDAANDGIIDWDVPSGHIIFSPRYYSMLGYDPHELPSDYSTWKSLLHPEDSEVINERICEHIRNKDTAFSYEFRLRKKSGEYIWILSRGKVARRDNEGNPVRVVGTHTDITLLKRTQEELAKKHEDLVASYEELASNEEELRNNFVELTRIEQTLRVSEERLLMAQEIGHTGCWEYYPENNTIWGSAEAMRMYGFPNEAGDLPIDEIEACIEDKERIRQVLIDFLEGKKDYDIDITVNPADGSVRRIVHSIAHLDKDADGNLVRVVGVIQDVTGQREAELKIKQAITQINRNIETLAILNDQIRNPLAVMCSISDTIGGDPGEQIIMEITRINNLVTQLDKEFLSSEKVREYLTRHCGISFDDEGPV